MPTGPGFPQNNNTYIPSDLSGKLRVGFSRDAKKFHLPKYVQYVEAPTSEAYYLKLTTQEAARIAEEGEVFWADGSPDRLMDTATESHNFVPFITKRRSFKFRLGDKATKQAVWPVVEQHSQIHAAKLMTNRTARMLTKATTASEWQAAGDTANLSANHTDTATVLGGAKFDVGTTANVPIKKALGKVAELINRDTLGVIDSDPGRYFVIMNPNEARLWAASPEIHDYIKGSYHAKEEVTEGLHPNNKYGLPSSVYGHPILIENAVKVTNKRGSAKVTAYAMPDSTVLVCTRPGGLDGIYGAPSFSTLSMFWWQDEMTVETKHEEWDRLTDGRVVEDTFEAVTCPASGYLITATSL